jgi:hypothetical protein
MSPTIESKKVSQHQSKIVMAETTMTNISVSVIGSSSFLRGRMTVFFDGGHSSNRMRKMETSEMRPIGMEAAAQISQLGCGSRVASVMSDWGDAIGDISPPMLAAKAIPRISVPP